MRTVLVILAAQLLIGTSAIAGSDIRKARERQAKQVANEAKALEEGGRLAEARSRYLAAEGVFPTKDALKGLARVAKESAKRIAALLDGAHAAFSAGDVQGALGILDQARELDPDSAAIAYDAALCHLRLGNRAEALDLLDFSAARAPDERLATDVAALAALVKTGQAPAPLDAPEAAKVAEIEALAHKRDTTGACALLRDVYQALPDNAPATYNLGRCEEEAGRLTEASALYRRYLELAPSALNAPEIEERVASLSSYAATLPDDASIRDLHVRAFQAIQSQRLRDGIAALKEATTRAPQHAETWGLLSTVYEAIGDTEAATRALDEYAALMPEERRESVRQRVAGLPGQRARYQEHVGRARSRIASLLVRYFWDVVSFAYAQDELAKAQVDLEAALQEFPFGGDAHCLLALISQQGARAATENSTTVLRGLGTPVRFYAAVRPKGSKRASPARVDLAPGVVSVYPVNEHDLQGTLCVSDDVEDPEQHRLTALSRVETDGNTLVLAAAGFERLDLFPAVLVTPYPPDGPAGRRLINRYTRLFQSEAKFEGVKLGNERMTGFEKVRLGLEFAANAYSGFTSAPVSATSLVKVLNAAYYGISSLATRIRSMYGLWGPPPFIPMPARVPRLAFRSPDFSEMKHSGDAPSNFADLASHIFASPPAPSPTADDPTIVQPTVPAAEAGPIPRISGIQEDKVVAVAKEPPPPFPALPDSAAPSSGILKFHVVPWADIEVNEKRVGQTPFEPLSLAAGTYVVRFVHPDYHPLTRQVVVVPGTTARVSVDFTWEGFRMQ